MPLGAVLRLFACSIAGMLVVQAIFDGRTFQITIALGFTVLALGVQWLAVEVAQLRQGQS